jgi:hypothetical protein
MTILQGSLVVVFIIKEGGYFTGQNESEREREREAERESERERELLYGSAIKPVRTRFPRVQSDSVGIRSGSYVTPLLFVHSKVS